MMIVPVATPTEEATPAPTDAATPEATAAVVLPVETEAATPEATAAVSTVDYAEVGHTIGSVVRSAAGVVLSEQPQATPQS
jgi:hypothetical protein